MAGITVARADIEFIGGVDIGEAQWAALDAHVRAAIAAVYHRPIDQATGRASSVLTAVYTSAILRILSNPTGARSVSLGSASTTTGGSDEILAEPLALTPGERADLAGAVAKARRPGYVRFTDPIWAPPLIPVPREEPS